MSDSKIEVETTYYWPSKEALHFRVELAHGLRERWYANGQLESRATYIKGRNHGLREVWYENGQLWLTENFDDGTLCGLRNLWREDGRLWARDNYVNGKRHGVCIKFADGKASETYYGQGVQLTPAEYKTHLTHLGICITLASELSEKSLGLLIAQYCDLLPSFPPFPIEP